MNILGVSAFYHDSAACLVCDGEIVAAAQEERFTRIKHDPGFPKNAVRYCLEQSALTNSGRIDLVAFYEKPFLKADRLFSTYLAVAPGGLRSFLEAAPVWIKQKIWIKQLLADELEFTGPILFPEHHESHAASAFFPSPFDNAATLTIDGVGEWTTTSIGRGKDNRVELLQELRFPHSLGLLYSAFTYYLGFRVNSGEYKVMGLAPYGEPRYRDLILSELVELKPDGSFHLNLKYFEYLAGLRMTNDQFDRLFGGPRREPESELTQRHMDVARSLQAVTEEIMLGMARHAHAVTGARTLCLAGGVALNCVANGRVLREGPFENIWIQPASGDAGGAIGAALLAWHHFLDQPRRRGSGGDNQKTSLLGPAYDPHGFVRRERIPHTKLDEDSLMTRTAELLDAGKVIGWYQGRMEFGPRALGNRSILADPRPAGMQERLNLKIKFRESFRPFAPAVLEERTSDYFEFDQPSPYMLLVATVKSGEVQKTSSPPAVFPERLRSIRSPIPAVTHVDYSARVQTVARAEHPRFHQLLREFERRTGCPVVINTSFNVRGEPPVCTPGDAYRCFMKTGMDYLVMENLLIAKDDHPPLLPDPAPKKQGWLLAEYEKLDRSPRSLRRFGLTIGAVLLGLALLLIARHRATGSPLAILAALIIGLAEFAPGSLRPLHWVWIRLSLALGWVMSRVLLTLFYFLVLTPIGLVQRLFGQSSLDVRFRGREETFWETRKTDFSRDTYEKQF
jgi:carbamoyltransferase